MTTFETTKNQSKVDYFLHCGAVTQTASGGKM